MSRISMSDNGDGVRSGTEQGAVVPDGRTPLWRAHNWVRTMTLIYAAVWFAFLVDDYDRPVLGSVIMAVMVAWTVFTILRYRHRRGRTNRLVAVDQVLVTVLFLLCSLVLTHAQMKAGLPTVVTLWQGSMVTVAAVQWGMLGGGISGAVAASCNFLLRGYIDANMWMDTVLHLGMGLLIGLASDTARRSTERLARALRAEAATAERERLARDIHDSVLQVLAHVRRRGRELGGDAADLAVLAGEQEIALRSLVAAAPPESTEDGDVDLGSRLQVLNSATVQVSVPATTVPLPAATASGLVAVVRETLSNVDKHAGPDARAWVLLEDLPGEVVVSVRDDGPGIEPGRLAAAEEQGHMGVAKSIRGRVRSLGGTIALDTAPGEGTEWEIRVPRSGAEHGRGQRTGEHAGEE